MSESTMKQYYAVSILYVWGPQYNIQRPSPNKIYLLIQKIQSETTVAVYLKPTIQANLKGRAFLDSGQHICLNQLLVYWDQSLSGRIRRIHIKIGLIVLVKLHLMLQLESAHFKTLVCVCVCVAHLVQHWYSSQGPCRKIKVGMCPAWPRGLFGH